MAEQVAAAAAAAATATATAPQSPQQSLPSEPAAVLPVTAGMNCDTVATSTKKQRTSAAAAATAKKKKKEEEAAAAAAVDADAVAATESLTPSGFPPPELPPPPPPQVRAPPPPEYFEPARDRSAPQSACDVRVDPSTDVLVLRTPQVGTLHKVFNAMRELMADVTMVVDRDRGTVSISGFERILGYCVDTVLRFEQQICRSPELTFSVPASSFYAMLIKAGPKHTVYMFVPQSSFVNGNVDYLHFQFETPPAAGGGAARVFTISLPTLNDPNPDHKFKLPPIAYPLRITLQSKQFGIDMRDLAEFGGENLQIEIRDGDCYFSSVLQTGATLGGRIHYPNICSAGGGGGGEGKENETGGESAAVAVVAPPVGFHFRDVFPLQIIKRIIKCGTLSKDVVVGICTGVPLNFYYPIGADFGDMNVYLAQSST